MSSETSPERREAFLGGRSLVVHQGKKRRAARTSASLFVGKEATDRCKKEKLKKARPRFRRRTKGAPAFQSRTKRRARMFRVVDAELSGPTRKTADGEKR
jgi:hypothetical protein